MKLDLRRIVPRVVLADIALRLEGVNGVQAADGFRRALVVGDVGHQARAFGGGLHILAGVKGLIRKLLVLGRVPLPGVGRLAAFAPAHERASFSFSPG